MNIRELCPKWLFPILQRAVSLPDILTFAYYKSKIKMKNNRVLLFSVSRSSLSGNLLYVYRALDKTKFDVDIVLEHDGTTKRELLRRMAAAKYIIIDDYTKIVYPLFMRKNARLIQVWHSTGAFKRMGFSRMGRKGSTVRTSLTHRNYTDVIVSSEDVVDNFTEAFGVKRECVHPLGVPRTDVFFDADYIEGKKAELWERYPFLKKRKVVMFAPTFRGETREDAHYPEKYLDYKRLADALGDDYVLCIKLHPFIRERVRIPDAYKERIVDLSQYREINDLLFITDILITDYSSVIFEYAFLKKPIVFYIPDLQQYISDRDFFYDFSEYIYGRVARNEPELVEAVRYPALDEDSRIRFCSRFLGACDGKASQRFVNTILME